MTMYLVSSAFTMERNWQYFFSKGYVAFTEAKLDKKTDYKM